MDVDRFWYHLIDFDKYIFAFEAAITDLSARFVLSRVPYTQLHPR